MTIRVPFTGRFSSSGRAVRIVPGNPPAPVIPARSRAWSMVPYWILADVTMAAHFAFIVFVVLGGLFLFVRPWIAALHLPAFAWGVLISVFGWECPLTPLENHFRRLAGEQGYETGFIEHYLLSVIYPEGLTRGHQLAMAISLLVVNGVIYGWFFRKRGDVGGAGE